MPKGMFHTLHDASNYFSNVTHVKASGVEVRLAWVGCQRRSGWCRVGNKIQSFQDRIIGGGDPG